MVPDYYSIDNILAEEEVKHNTIVFADLQQKVPIKMKVTSHHLGFLDPGSLDEDLQENVRVEVPLWMGATLCEKNFAEMLLPKYYSPKVLGNLKADANSVSFGGTAPFFYHVALRISPQLPRNESLKLVESIKTAAEERYKKILDKAHNMRDVDLHEFTRRLTVDERLLFEKGYLSTTEFERWKNGRTEQLLTSHTIKTLLNNIGNLSKNNNGMNINMITDPNQESGTARKRKSNLISSE